MVMEQTDLMRIAVKLEKQPGLYRLGLHQGSTARNVPWHASLSIRTKRTIPSESEGPETDHGELGSPAIGCIAWASSGKHRKELAMVRLV
jgi:hypothetical protein